MHSRHTRAALLKIIDGSPRSTPNHIIAPAVKPISNLIIVIDIAVIIDLVTVLVEITLDKIFVRLDVRADYRLAHNIARAVNENRRRHRFNRRQIINHLRARNNVDEIRIRLAQNFLRRPDRIRVVVAPNVAHQSDQLHIIRHLLDPTPQLGHLRYARRTERRPLVPNRQFFIGENFIRQRRIVDRPRRERRKCFERLCLLRRNLRLQLRVRRLFARNFGATRRRQEQRRQNRRQ